MKRQSILSDNYWKIFFKFEHNQDNILLKQDFDIYYLKQII